jgi:hypothetical protein
MLNRRQQEKNQYRKGHLADIDRYNALESKRNKNYEIFYNELAKDQMNKYRNHKKGVLNYKRKRDKVFDDFAEQRISKQRPQRKARNHTKQY